MAPTPTPAQLAALLKPVKEALALILIGFILSTTLYGISILQCFQYYMTYSDRPWLKILVAALMIADSLSTALVSHSVYTYMVLNLGNLAANTKQIWSFQLENGILQVVTVLAQGFFAHQIYKVGGHKAIVGFVTFLSAATFALGIKETVYIFQHKDTSTLRHDETLIVGGLVQGLAALCDIIITVSLVYYLREKRENVMSNTRATVDRIIMNAVSRGTVTAVCQILFLVLNVAIRGHIYWNPFHQLVGKLYVNSVLSTLNLRRSLRVAQGGSLSQGLSTGNGASIPASTTYGGSHVKFSRGTGVHVSSQKATYVDDDVMEMKAHRDVV